MNSQHRYRVLFWCGWWSVCLSWLWIPQAAEASKLHAIAKASELLGRWRASEADKLLEPYSKDRFQSTDYIWTMARTRFYQGRYKEALSWFERLSKNPKDLLKYPMYRAVLSAYKVTKHYQVVHSPHFTIAFPPGLDRVLVPYAIRALEKAYQELGDLYGYRPPTRVRIEFLSSALQLAEMSPLTEGDISRTGTIALCKYNRIMITSPRALYQGYRWLDTLVHEYTHLVINRVVAGIPIWLHEGLARYSETLWRDPTPQKLSPYAETLLARALKKDTLIPFERMHPSMAKLPSQEDAALAYAQVYTLIRYFVRYHGQSSIARVLHEIHQGQEIPKAFSIVVKMPFDQYLETWKYHLRQLQLKEFNDLAPDKKIIKGLRPTDEEKKKAEEKEKSFWHQPNSPQELGARFLQLGELLRMRKRNQAAILEYLKAEKYWKNLKPQLQNKIAKTYFSLKQHSKAIPHLQESLKLHPNYVTTYVNLGMAHFFATQFKEAIRNLEEAAHINPFDPSIHQYLSIIYRKTGDEVRSHQAAKTLQLLRQGE